jgi:hypothetical protein
VPPQSAAQGGDSAVAGSSDAVRRLRAVCATPRYLPRRRVSHARCVCPPCPISPPRACAAQEADLSRELEALFANPPPEPGTSAPPAPPPLASLPLVPSAGAPPIGDDVARLLASSPPLPPTAPDPAAARGLREARQEALRRAPLQALRDVSVELALRRAERSGSASAAAKAKRARPAPPPAGAAAAGAAGASALLPALLALPPAVPTALALRPTAPPPPAPPPGGAQLAADEVLLRVTMYNPSAKRDLVPAREVLVLGSQTLAQLRDALTCASDATAARFCTQARAWDGAREAQRMARTGRG